MLKKKKMKERREGEGEREGERKERNYIFNYLFIFCGTRDQTQGFAHARLSTTELYHQPLVFETRSQFVAHASLELSVCLPQPLEF
jgi:hypothetical protein